MDWSADLQSIDWASIDCCYGPATPIPGWLRDVVDGDDVARSEALDELPSSLCHQGTVYPCSEVAVPFLADIAGVSSLPDVVRAQVALLIAAIGNGMPAGGNVDAVRGVLGRALRDIGDAPPATQAALLAAAAVAPNEISPAAMAVVTSLESSSDLRISAAAQIVRRMRSERLGYDELVAYAPDPVTAEYVAGCEEVAEAVQTSCVVFELVSGVVSQHIANEEI